MKLEEEMKMSVLTNIMHEREEWSNKHCQLEARRMTLKSFLYYVYMALLILIAFNLSKVIDFIKSI